MSQLLLFGGNDTSGLSGWFDYKELGKKAVENLEKEAGKGGANPKVSIPSPFARFELQQTAFRNVKTFGDKSQPRDKSLVFCSLDIAQLFFENQDGIQITEWRVNDQIAELENSFEPGHRQLAKVLKLYIAQEKYGFDKNEVIYMISYKGISLGCTSPTSLFMPTPNIAVVQEKVNIALQNGKLFFCYVPLHKRAPRFVEYLYHTLGAVYRSYTSLYNAGMKDCPLSDVIDYFIEEEKLLPNEVQNNVRGWISNENVGFNDYVPSEIGVSLFGFNLYQSTRADAHKEIEMSSSFTINSNKSTKKSLVLTNTKGGYDSWSYISKGKSWKYCIKNGDVKTGVRRDEAKTTLPTHDGTRITYNDEWLCENDFLEDIIIRLPYPFDKEKFFDGNLKPGNFHKQQQGENEFYYYYLPPIRKKFFKFFDIRYLSESVGNSANFQIEELKNGSVKVSLRIPVRGGVVTLVKTYENKNFDFQTVQKPGPDDSLFEAKGNVVEFPVALNMMPFVKLSDEKTCHYSIQLLKSLGALDGIDLKLEAFKSGETADTEVPMSEYKRSDNTLYYDLDNHSFDYFVVNFVRKLGSRSFAYESVLIPKLSSVPVGGEDNILKFAFDFGTSNSYLAVKNGNAVSDVILRNVVCGTLDETKIDNTYKGDRASIESLMLFQDQEFIPNDKGVECTFPHRTVLSYSKTNTVSSTQLSSLHDVNIPFIYGKGDYGMANNGIKTGFKWSSGEDSNKYVNAFIDELAKIAYAYAVKNGAPLNKCSFIWTYPLSMNTGATRDFEKYWKRAYNKYFLNSNDDYDDDSLEGKVEKMTESVAPFLKYSKDDLNIAETTLSIDIGGGTSDVVIYRDIREGGNDKNNEETKGADKMNFEISIVSFRFAADNIFGGGGSMAKYNKMIRKYYKKISDDLNDLANKDDGSKKSDYTKVKKLLDNFCGNNSQKEPAEANSVLFSLEDNPYLSGAKISYNGYLSDDRGFRIIFIYFYAAIIYYLTDLLLAYGKPKPENVLFSGTGSKLLNIIGDKSALRDMTTQLIQAFSDGGYRYEKDVTIKIEKNRPKQLTAEGALNADTSGRCKDIADLFKESKKRVDDNIIRHSMILSDDGKSIRKLLNKDRDDAKTLMLIAQRVKDFHQKLYELCSSDKFDLENDYNCDDKAIEFVGNLAKMKENEIESAMRNILLRRSDNIQDKDDKEMSDPALFFCPIINIIDNFLKEEQE